MSVVIIFCSIRMNFSPLPILETNFVVRVGIKMLFCISLSHCDYGFEILSNFINSIALLRSHVMEDGMVDYKNAWAMNCGTG